MSARLGLVLDCEHPEALAGFWAPALGYTNVGAAGNYVMLIDSDGIGPQMLLQQVAEPKAVKNRMHVDFHVADIAAEAARLTALGARQVASDPVSEHGMHWYLMTDPEGNEFCICDGGC